MPSILLLSCIAKDLWQLGIHVIASTRRFALLYFPSRVQQAILEDMSLIEVIQYSFESKQAMEVVKKLDLECVTLRLDIIDSVILTLIFVKKPYMRLYLHLDITDVFDSMDEMIDVQVTFDLDEVDDWRIPNLGLRGMIAHFMELLSLRELDQFKIYFSMNRFDLLDLKRELKGFPVGCLEIHPLSMEDMKSAMNTIGTPNKLVVDSTKVPTDVLDHNYLRSLSAHNFVLMCINSCVPQSVGTLNDVLITNVAKIKIFGAAWTQKDLNRFLKLWAKGSMPRLAHLKIKLHDILIPDMSVVLKGVDHEEKEDYMEIRRLEGKNGRFLWKRMPDCFEFSVL
uniref:FBA_2 domain-containing protein n=1 Tax=Caenorhabditis tropicalis TaxID=1561998 RepID=A0A1I7TH53_9PELO